MIDVHVQYFAVLRERAGRNQETVATAATTAADLYDELAARHPFGLPRSMLLLGLFAAIVVAGWFLYWSGLIDTLDAGVQEEVALKADLIVAAEHARFGIPEVKRGLFAAGGGTRLPARIPLQMALELGLTGDPIGAQRAYDLGVVNRVVPAAELLSAARALAATIAANGPLAVRATKELMWGEIGESDTAAHGQWAARVFASDDAREGAIAFAEKRAPAWKGR